MRKFSEIIQARDWENQHITYFNVIEAHAPLYSYHSLKSAIHNESSEFMSSLNGQWRFNLFSQPEVVPAEFR
ncbi:hypothetical protein [Psychromonas sp. MME2]|uniref:hypothetical protein n=1 Tax=Psychromonas sp. MME2 TaxID=3231033 RepID=UPI00339C2C02